jgi:hypothetical protein
MVGSLGLLFGGLLGLLSLVEAARSTSVGLVDHALALELVGVHIQHRGLVADEVREDRLGEARLVLLVVPVLAEAHRSMKTSFRNCWRYSIAI